jgi:hypothetical protein
MGLAATLTTRLDCRNVGASLLTQLTGPGDNLEAIGLPLSAEQLNGVTGAAGLVDSSPLAGAVAQLAGRIPQALSALPQSDLIVRPLREVIDLAGQLAANDVPTLFEQVLERLRNELRNPPAGGHAALLFRLAELLRDAPEGQALQRVISGFVPALNLGNGGDFPFLDILRGVEGATQVLGALMCLETVLAEAERLAATMSVRLDPGAIAHHTAALAEALGDGTASLAARLAAVDAGDTGTLAALTAQVVALASELAVLRERYAVGLAMDEATLAYLDIDRLQSEVDAARAMIRNADVDPARRVSEALARLLQPVLSFELPGSPAGGIAALIDSAEAQVGQLATTLDTLDLAFLTDPLSAGLRTLTQPLRELQGLIDSVIVTLRGALDQVREVVAALPLDDLADTLRTFLAPIAQALDAVRELLAQIEAALQTAADATSAALNQVDAALDAFQQQIDAFFGEARAAVEQVNLSQAVAAVADKVQAFADLLGQAQMKPYFDTAVTAIDAATGVVEVVPFDLLPESMKADVDALVQPIKEVDVDAVEQQIETLLGVTPDGKFALRGQLDQAIAQVHEKFQTLLDVVEEHHPRALLAEVDARIDELAAKVREIEPDLTLQPLRDALDTVRDAVGSLDLDALLQPVRDAFAQVTGALDQLSVAQLVAPVQEQLDAARDAVIRTLRIDAWETSLDDLRSKTLAMLERVNPQALRAPLVDAFAELATVLQRFPALNAGAGLGVVLAAMLAGSGRRIQPNSFGPVLHWLGGEAGSVALAAHSERLAQSLGHAADLLAIVDPALAGTALNSRFAQLRTAVQGLLARLDAGQSAHATLTATLPTLDSAALFNELSTHRARYQQSLQEARGLAGTFQRSGFSEADVGVAALLRALEPLQPAAQKVRALFRAIGLADEQISVASVLRTLLAAAPPQRIVDLVMPIFEALHRRLASLLDGVLDPLRAATADLRTLLAALDLAPLVDAAEGIVAQARSEIEALSPDRLLAEPLQSFADLRTAIVDDDPLVAVSALLSNLRELIARVLDKLSLERLLEQPLAIYDHILGEIRSIDPRGLLDPVFDQLDVIASQVDSGLDDTVTSFKRLQDALPAGGGGSSAAVSGSISS